MTDRTTPETTRALRPALLHFVVAALGGVAIAGYLAKDVDEFVVLAPIGGLLFGVPAALFGDRFLDWSRRHILPWI